MKVVLTFDIDWAPEQVIEYTVELLENAGAIGTFFATHRSDVLLSLANSKHEIALHPNYLPMVWGEKKFDPAVPIDTLKEIYPEARGARTHGLFMMPQIIGAMMNAGLDYDSSILLRGLSDVGPFCLFPGFYRIPFHWEDDVHFIRKDPYRSSFNAIRHGIPIFNYHPIHVFLNTESQETYERAKPFYQFPADLQCRRNSSAKGTKDHLMQILNAVKMGQATTVTMSSLLETKLMLSAAE